MRTPLTVTHSIFDCPLEFGLRTLCMFCTCMMHAFAQLCSISCGAHVHSCLMDALGYRAPCPSLCHHAAGAILGSSCCFGLTSNQNATIASPLFGNVSSKSSCHKVKTRGAQLLLFQTTFFSLHNHKFSLAHSDLAPAVCFVDSATSVQSEVWLRRIACFKTKQ